VKLNTTSIKSVLMVYEEMVNNGLSLVYLGEFNQEITKMFTAMAEEEMLKSNEEALIKKRVYHVMVETLQNMKRHSDEIADKNTIGKGLFMIGKSKNAYHIITCNKILNEKKVMLQAALDQINSSTPEELNDMYRQQIKNGKISSKGGAGLGLIDIARKTEQKHDYQFLPHDDENFLFILRAEINIKLLTKVKQDYPS